MGKSEILLIIVGIIFTIVLATTMAPSFIKAGSFAKTSIVINEIKSFRDVSNNYLNTNGDYSNISMEKLIELLPGIEMKIDEDWGFSYFTNKYNVMYYIYSIDGNSYYLIIYKLNSIDTDVEDVEELIIENFKHIAKNKNDLEHEYTTDGFIVLELDN